MKHIYTFESFLNESSRVIRQMTGDHRKFIIDAANLLKDVSLIEKEIKGKIPYSFELLGMPTNTARGVYGGVEFKELPDGKKMTVEEYIDVLNKIFNDNGFSKYNVKIEK